MKERCVCDYENAFVSGLREETECKYVGEDDHDICMAYVCVCVCVVCVCVCHSIAESDCHLEKGSSRRSTFLSVLLSLGDLRWI